MANNPKDLLARSSGKVPLGLFPDTAIVAGSLGMLEGRLKYGGHNFRVAPIDASVYNDALKRHLASWWNGEDIDPESGIPHTWKMLSCLAVLVDAELTGSLVDDRPPKAPVAELLNQLKARVKEIEARCAEYKPIHYYATTPEDV